MATDLSSIAGEIENAAKLGGVGGIDALLKNPAVRAFVTEVGTVSIKIGSDPFASVYLTGEGLEVLRIRGSWRGNRVLGTWDTDYNGEPLDLSGLSAGFLAARERHLKVIKRRENVRTLVGAAPDVAAALVPDGVAREEYLENLLADLEYFPWPAPQFAAVLEGFSRSSGSLAFLQSHPELRSLELAGHNSGPAEQQIEKRRSEAIQKRYPERGEPKRGGAPYQIMHGSTLDSLWNPLELLALTRGDLSFYARLERELSQEEFSLIMEKDGYDSNGEAFIGVKPYGKQKEGILPHLGKLKHGAWIGFYVIAQAAVGEEKVAVIETMQSDLLSREKDGPELVPKKGRNYYAGHERWLRHTLPQIENALAGTGVGAVLIPTADVILAERSGNLSSLERNELFKQTYRLPGKIGYQQGKDTVEFLRGKSVTGTYWIKVLR